MVKYHYPFEFDFDYDLFLHDANQLSKHQIHHTRTGAGADYKKAEHGDDITLSAYKIPLYKIKSLQDNKHCKSIIRQCKKLFDAIEFSLWIKMYIKGNFLQYHVNIAMFIIAMININIRHAFISKIIPCNCRLKSFNRISTYCNFY